MQVQHSVSLHVYHVMHDAIRVHKNRRVPSRTMPPSSRTDITDIYHADTDTTGVVVTGASGYVGGAIVSFLLAKTSVPRVHATVRGDVNAPRYAALRSLDPVGLRLRVFSADLETPGAFDEPCRDCSAIIHVAAPTTIRCRKPKQAYERMIDPAIKGVENVVSSVEKMGLRTMVLTSSMAAVQGDGWERGRGHVYTEEDWNDLNATPEKNSYACMKVQTERRCLDLFDGREVRDVRGKAEARSSWERLVVLCPGLVLGAPSTDVRSEWVDFVTLLMQGKIWPVIPNYEFSMVHLEDVAKAHVLAAIGKVGELNAPSRYILAAGDRTLGMTGLVCGRLKEGVRTRIESREGSRIKYTSALRWPMGAAPRWILRVLSWFMDSVQWPLVEAHLDKPSRFDGGKIVREVEGFGAYLDPVDGFLELLEWIVDERSALQR